ncbi:hypothetical protein Droror1_Dr00003186 [Drosera rotundifolia]
MRFPPHPYAKQNSPFPPPLLLFPLLSLQNPRLTYQALRPILGGFFEVFFGWGKNSMWSPGAVDRNSQLLTPPRRFPFSSTKPPFSQQPPDYHRFDGGECRTSQEPDAIIVRSPQPTKQRVKQQKMLLSRASGRAVQDFLK